MATPDGPAAGGAGVGGDVLGVALGVGGVLGVGVALAVADGVAL